MKQSFVLCCICISSLLNAQESISHLISNPCLSHGALKSTKGESALSLPFIDDFSYPSNVVDANLWHNSSVFVNRSYPINPPTLGVATFDGMDEEGLARDFTPNSPSEPSDTLLSKEIDLAGLSSVFIMFYYQLKGLGDAPEIQDKLVLEFFNDTLGWEEVWSSTYIISNEFIKVVQVIDQPRFLHDSFQFRFRSYATISGNFDHFHIDYIKIDELLSVTDTSKLDDVSFVYSSPSLLQRYYEMPWRHFLNNELYELKDSIDIKIRNNHASTNVDYQYNIFENNNQIFHYPINGISRNVSIFDYDTVGNFTFLNPPINVYSNMLTSFHPDSAAFVIQNIIGTSASDNKLNDTLYHTQKFYSHFAYDDGIAESAYGLNIDGAKIAYEFKLNRPDTLRAVQMYFPQMLDSLVDITFKLTVWENISGNGSIIYQQIVPLVHTPFGEYHTYYLDSLFQLVGTFYVGWEQTSDDLLNVGFDMNNISNDYMFYNIGSGWNTSSYPGSWMIRPLLSIEPIISTQINFNKQLKIYPNPTKGEIYIETLTQNNFISIYSLQGVLVKKFFVVSNSLKLDITDLASGVYFVEILNDKQKISQKIVLQ